MAHSVPRVIAIVLSVLVYFVAIVINALAGMGRPPFHSSTGDVSRRHETDITPADFTFCIWGVIYTWLALTVVYLASLVCRTGDWSLALLPYAFYLCWICNMILSMLWLVLWDRELMMAALAVLVLIALTNFCMLVFCSYSVDLYGVWLGLEHPNDLFFLRLLVQNGLALYASWTSFCTLINFSLVLNLMGVAKDTSAIACLCILQVALPGWFFLENFVVDRSVRYVLTVYPAVIMALFGNLIKHYDPARPTPIAIFMLVLLALACAMHVVRVAMMIWRSSKQPPLARGVSTELLMSPLMSPAISIKKRKIFM